ncbi:MAG: glycogen synthase GlgA [Bryobacteraceae bacterium]
MARILMVAAEAAPFAHTGGLSEVLRAFPKALAEAGEETVVVLPHYRGTALADERPVYERLRIAVGPHTFVANILEERAKGVRYLFVHIPELYDRGGLYGDENGDFADNHIRFAALCQAALGVARHVFVPDVIHCHDWHAALLPFLLRRIYNCHPAYIGLKTVFTIHNLGFQGIFPESVADDLGLPKRLPERLQEDPLRFWGRLNLMKGALATSDLLSTVSPRYAEEIQTPEFGFGLDPVLRERSASLRGILNGADCEFWNPETDKHLTARFSRGDPDGKQECKRALLQELGLPAERATRPVIGILSRFTAQKGLDLLMRIPHELVAENVSLVVLGSGEQPLEDFFRWFAQAYPAKVAVRFGYDDGLAHRLIAGSDLLLMPSRYEPCGLNQIYAMRYGTLPLVRATGGLADTVDEDAGFRFERFDPYALLACIRDAVRAYGSERWTMKREAAMQRDFSWRHSAEDYIRLYRQALAGVH